MKRLLSALLLLTCIWMCREDITLPDIGESISSPMDVKATPSGKYFLVLNANLKNKYKTEIKISLTSIYIIYRNQKKKSGKFGKDLIL